jgi:hypothetical protein
MIHPKLALLIAVAYLLMLMSIASRDTSCGEKGSGHWGTVGSSHCPL